MGSEAETEENPTTPRLPLFSLGGLRSPEHSGTLTPPLQTNASVPFRWEEQPGKPLPCTTLALPLSNNGVIKCLELPPRLLNEGKMTKTPSPTTVLEGPYNKQQGRAILESSSFRFLRKRQGSFDGIGTLSLGGSRGSSPDRGLLGAMVLSNSGCRRENKGLLGSWRKRSGHGLKGKGEAHGGNFVFSSFSDDGTGGSDGGAASETTKMSRKRSLLSLSPAKSHFWAAIYGTFKQVIPRRSAKTKWKKDAP